MASMRGLRVWLSTRCVPSLSSTVPSAKTWRNMPNWVPSSERPSETRVTSGSDSVAALLTRGRGTIRGDGDGEVDVDAEDVGAPAPASNRSGEPKRVESDGGSGRGVVGGVG